MTGKERVHSLAPLLIGSDLMSVWLDGEGPYDLDEIVEGNLGILSLDEIDRMIGDLETVGLHVVCLGRGGIMTVKVAE
jgi:hypothetical protein